MKNQKGITLVALIITIIVMVILAGVIIAASVADGGIIDRAQAAMKENERAEAEELVIASYVYKTTAAMTTVGTLDLTLTADAIYKNLTSNGFELMDRNVKAGSGSDILEGDKINLNIIGKHGEYTGTVTENGLEKDGVKEIIGTIPPSTEVFNWESVGLTVDTYTEYIADNGIALTFLKEGILQMVGDGVISTIDATVTDNVVDGQIRFSEKIEGENAIFKLAMNNENEDRVDLIMIVLDENGIELGSMVFTCEKTIIDNEQIYSNDEILKRLNITNYTGTYRGTWTKIGEEDEKIKLVSTSDVSNYTLGYDDPISIDEIQIAGTQPTQEEKVERAIFSYINAESSLDKKAQEATGIKNARSIRIKDIEGLITIEKGTNYGEEYTYDYTNHKDQIFVDKNMKVVKIDSTEKKVILEDTYYYDELTKEEIGCLATGSFWTADSFVKASDTYAMFGVRRMSSGSTYYSYLYSSHGEFRGYEESINGSVRAVISIPAK